MICVKISILLTCVYFLFSTISVLLIVWWMKNKPKRCVRVRKKECDGEETDSEPDDRNLNKIYTERVQQIDRALKRTTSAESMANLDKSAHTSKFDKCFYKLNYRSDSEGYVCDI